MRGQVSKLLRKYAAKKGFTVRQYRLMKRKWKSLTKKTKSQLKEMMKNEVR